MTEIVTFGVHRHRVAKERDGNRRDTMSTLRGMSTINLWAEDLAAATRWYTELLGVAPYFTSEAAGRGPGYVEFRIGDLQHELGIIDRRFAPAGLVTERGGAIAYWHVDDVAATFARLLALGATPLEGITERGPGFVTASVIDPFGNVLGIMFNRHYLDVVGSLRAPQ
ncbi:Putative dioxygenase [Minicystis rosea]|nr:Putative dioxygenase [Minicystis rosea]